MSVVIETTLGDITVDLYLDQRPVTCLNFLKLCKMKYYNYNLFHTIRSDFIAQTGDPTGEGTGGESIWGILEGPQKRFFSGEKMPKIRHTGAGLLSMVCTDEMMVGSQFFFTLAPDLDSLDGVHCVIGEVTEGQEVLTKLNEVICDETNRPYRDVRITHTVVLEDPFNDPPGLRAPSRSPSPNPERLKGGRIAPDEEIDEAQGKSMEEVQELIEEKEAKARATILEIVGDLPDADIAPPENVLFVCKLNPVTTDDDLEIIFSRFGKIVSCEVIRDKKTENSLQYAFIEFENKKSCEDAYFKMDNVLIDDRRIHVDFSQSVSKMRYLGKGRGVQYLNDEVITNPEIKKRGERGYTSRDSHNDRRKHDKEKRGDTSKRYENEKDSKSSRGNDRRHYDRERDDKSRTRQNERKKYNNEEDDRSRRRHNDREREDLSRKHYNNREREDPRRKFHHDQRQQERNESREVNTDRKEKESKNSRSCREHRYDKDRRNTNMHKSQSRSRSRNHSTERLFKNGDRKTIKIENRNDRNNKQTTKIREMSSSPKRQNERSPRRQKESRSGMRNDNKESHDIIEKNHKSSEESNQKKLQRSEHKIRDDHENNKKTKQKDSRTPSPVVDKKKEKSTKRKDKNKTSSNKKNSSKRKHKKSTSSDSDSESSSSTSDSSSSSDSDKKKSKARRRKRKYSSSSSSESSSISSSSDSTSDSSSSSSDSEPRKKKVKRNKNKSSKSSKK